jgi:hypothetical protein
MTDEPGQYGGRGEDTEAQAEKNGIEQYVPGVSTVILGQAPVKGGNLFGISHSLPSIQIHVVYGANHLFRIRRTMKIFPDPRSCHMSSCLRQPALKSVKEHPCPFYILHFSV